MLKVVLTLVCLVYATAVEAQVVVTPTSTLTFPANPAHATVVAGLDVVTSYQVKILPQGSTTVVFGPRDASKPMPNASNMISVPIGWTAAQLSALASGAYVAVITVVGPGGTTDSGPSVPFAHLISPPPQGKPVVVR